MTKSRTVLALLLSLVSAPAIALPAGADQALDAQRSGLRTMMRLDCPPAADDEEIVVCGSRDEDRRQRLPLAIAPAPRAADRAGGEQRAALAAAVDPCTPVGRDQQCNGGLDLIGIGFTIARAIARAIARGD
jgi:hypothetical protein